MAADAADSVKKRVGRSWWSLALLFTVTLFASAGLALSESTLAGHYRHRLEERARDADWPWLLEYPDSNADLDLADFGRTGPLEPTATTVEVRLDGLDATIVTRWAGPRDHPLVRAALAYAGGDGRPVRDAMVTAYLSAIAGRRTPVDLDVSLLGDEATVHTTERSRIVDSGSLTGHVSSRPGLPAFVRVSEVRLDIAGGPRFVLPAWSPLPDRMDGRLVIWKEALEKQSARDLDPSITFYIDTGSSLDTGGSVERRRPSRGASITAWANDPQPAWLAAWVFPVLSTLPFFLGVLWAGRHARRSRQRFVALLSLQLLTVGVAAAWRLVDAVYAPIKTSSVSYDPTDERQVIVAVLRVGLSSSGLVAVAMAGVVVGWLVVARRVWSRSLAVIAPPSDRLRSVGALLLAFVAIATIAVPAWDLGWAVIGVATTALAMVVMLATVSTLWRRDRGSAIASGLGVVATIELTSFASAFDVGPGGALDTTVSVTFAMLAVMAILATFCIAACALLTGSSPLAWLRRQRGGAGGRLLVVGAGLLVIAALTSPQLMEGRTLTVRDSVDLSRELAELFPFLLVVLLVRELRTKSDESPASGWAFASVWQAGAIALLALVFEPTKTFWFVPVAAPVALGGLWLLFHVTAYRGPSQPYPPLHQRLPVLAKLVALRRLERIDRRARDERLAKVAAGAMTEAESASAQAAIDGQRKLVLADLPSEAGDTVDSLDWWVSGYGPGETAWHSGTLGAAYAAVVGLPWIIVYWRQALIEPGDPLFALETVLPMVTIALTWLGYGFFFGYYYAHIPGRRAVTKSVVLAAVLVAPFVFYGAAVLVPRGVESWTSLSVLSAQIVGHLLVLAVLFDLHLVRQAGMPGGVVIELRDLRPLVSWAGALGVAVGGVVTSVLVTSFATALSTGLGFLTSPEGPSPAPATVVTTTLPSPTP